MRLLKQTTSPRRLSRMMRPGGRSATKSQRMDADSGRHLSKFTALEGQRRAQNDLSQLRPNQTRDFAGRMHRMPLRKVVTFASMIEFTSASRGIP